MEKGSELVTWKLIQESNSGFESSIAVTDFGSVLI